MKEQPITSIRSDALPDGESTKGSTLPRCRSAVYGFVSSLYSDPSSKKFDLLHGEEYRSEVMDACRTLDRKLSANNKELETAARELFELVSSDVHSVEDEYVSTFGHTLSKPTAPYELEHLRNEDVFYRTQILADLEGFYHAFGLDMQVRERGDHISVEAEFLAFLLAKEAYALIHDLEDEKIDICRAAQRKFWKDHFSGWAEMFAGNLMEHSRGTFYSSASRFASLFLGYEHNFMDRT